MRLLLDQGLPRSTAAKLRSLGFEVAHVGELGFARATDEDILALAKNRGDVVVTLDADFHALLAQSGSRGPSVVRLRVQGKGAAELAQLISAIAKVTSEDLKHGAAVSASDSTVRVRLLPIGC